jgi:hypothetical protein
MAVRQSFAQSSDLCAQVLFGHGRSRPDPSDQLLAGRDLAGALHQRGQQLNGAAAETDVSPVVFQDARSGEELERAELEHWLSQREVCL